MAILQHKPVNLESVLNISGAGSVNLPVVTRLARIEFISHCELLVVFQVFVGTTRQPDVTFKFAAFDFVGEPPQDIVDPVSGDVLMPAGSIDLPRPSLEKFLVQPLEGEQTVLKTVGELFDYVKRQMYLKALCLDPELAGGEEA